MNTKASKTQGRRQVRKFREIKNWRDFVENNKPISQVHWREIDRTMHNIRNTSYSSLEECREWLKISASGWKTNKWYIQFHGCHGYQPISGESIALLELDRYPTQLPPIEDPLEAQTALSEIQELYKKIAAEIAELLTAVPFDFDQVPDFLQEAVGGSAARLRELCQIPDNDSDED